MIERFPINYNGLNNIDKLYYYAIESSLGSIICTFDFVSIMNAIKNLIMFRHFPWKEEIKFTEEDIIDATYKIYKEAKHK